MAQTNERGRFVWYELTTSDPASAQAFYRAVVGWETKKFGDGGNSGMDYTLWMAGDTAIGGLIPMVDAAAVTEAGVKSRWIAYTEVPNVDAVAAQVKRRGGKVTVPPTSAPDIGRFGAFVDPEGAAFAAITSQYPLAPEGDPKLGEFSWHELTTSDYDAAERFYAALFGWDKKNEFDTGEMGVYHMFGRDRFTYGGMFSPAPGLPPRWMHYVLVDDAEAAAQRASKAGGAVINGPMEVPGGDHIAAILDPQGAMFSVHSKAI